MTINVLPPLFEISEFRGWAPSVVAEAMPQDMLRDVSNVLPRTASTRVPPNPYTQNIVQRWTTIDALETRKGFDRVAITGLPSVSGATGAPGALSVINTWQYGAGHQTTRNFWLLQLSNGATGSGGVNSTSGAANNVQFWLVNLTSHTATVPFNGAYGFSGATGTTGLAALAAVRVDLPGRTWKHPTHKHWAVDVQGTIYGGVKAEDMWSYDLTNGWNPSAGVPALHSLGGPTRVYGGSINSGSSGATGYGPSGNEWPMDYSFRAKDVASTGGKYYQTNSPIRADQRWEDGVGYGVGERVNDFRNWGQLGSFTGATGNGYMKTFQCIQQHSSTGASRPSVNGDGSWQTYWKRIRLPTPLDPDSGEVADSWDLVPVAAQSSLATWHGDRLWLKYDLTKDESRVQYSAPGNFKHGADISSFTWDPTNFKPADTTTNEGGGWRDFSTHQNNSAITALYSFGQYLLVFKEGQVWALSGEGDLSFNNRYLSLSHGAIGPRCVVEFEGQVYFLGHTGLYVTDGTSVEAVPGMEHVQTYLQDRVRQITGTDSWLALAQEIELWQDGQFVWMSMPLEGADDGEGYVTIAYHPQTWSFWKTNLPVYSHMHAVIDQALPTHVFTTPPKFAGNSYGSASGPILLYRYGSNDSTDDTGASGASGAAIVWHATTAWWPFGPHNEQRRIRRTWALVKSTANAVISLVQKRNWQESTLSVTTTTTLPDTAPHYIEGAVMADSNCISLTVSGAAAPADLYAVSIDTQPRRIRYHSGSE